MGVWRYFSQFMINPLGSYLRILDAEFLEWWLVQVMYRLLITFFGAVISIITSKQVINKWYITSINHNSRYYFAGFFSRVCTPSPDYGAHSKQWDAAEVHPGREATLVWAPARGPKQHPSQTVDASPFMRERNGTICGTSIQVCRNICGQKRAIFNRVRNIPLWLESKKSWIRKLPPNWYLKRSFA